jgi:HAD superfamily hydrolase (TIGR01509 family)
MVSFVYFDVGGVVMKDFSGSAKWKDLEMELGIAEDSYIDFTKFWDSYEPELCRGKEADSLLPVISKHFGIIVPLNYSIMREGFVSRFEENKSIWPVVTEVQKTHKTGLLTNMYPGMLNAIHARKLLDDFAWDVTIDSSVVGFQKPDHQIYEIAQERAGVKPSEILFIDNSAKNIEGAKKAGWQTFHYDATNPQKASKELMEAWRKIRDVTSY